MITRRFSKIITIALFSLAVAAMAANVAVAAEDAKKEVKELVIIVNPAAKITNMKLTDLKKIYEVKMKTLTGIGKLALVNLPKTDPARIFFSMLVLKKSAEDMERVYMKSALSGKGQPPKVLKTEKEILEFVKKNKTAMAYVRASTKLEGVKTLTVDKKKTVSEKKEEN